MKLAILPRNIPIEATQTIISVKTNILILFFFAKIIEAIKTPMAPP